MNISLIVAVSDNGVIGKDNAVPWRSAQDMAYFKKITMGKPVVMGRKTWESLGKPLPGRPNLVISRQRRLILTGAQVFPDLPSALKMAQTIAGPEGEIMIIGGAQIYAEALPLANRIYLTQVHATVQGDAFFPPLDKDEWKEISHQFSPAAEGDTADVTFTVLERCPAHSL